MIHQLLMHAYQLCSPGYISVDGTGRVLQQCVQSSLKVGRLFTLLNTHVEELVEVFQGVLVHWVHLGQGRYDKVHHGATSSHLAVFLSRS